MDNKKADRRFWLSGRTHQQLGWKEDLYTGCATDGKALL